MKKSRAISFDLWNTLIKNVNLQENRIAFLVEKFEPLGVSPEETRDAFSAMNDAVWHAWEIPPHDFIDITQRVSMIEEIIGKKLGKREKDETVDFFETCILDDPPALHAGVGDTLREVAKAHKVALLSDTGYSPGTIMKKVLANHGIIEYFDCLVFSDEIGVNKPNMVIFQAMLGNLGMEATSTMHVGDLLRTDINGAKGVGMKAVWVDRVDNPLNKESHAAEPDYVIREIPDLLDLLS